jgi:hypothetical protein
MRLEELLDRLRDDPTEANLAETGLEYYAVEGVADDPDYLGTVFVVTDDGLAALPYTEVLAGQGYEQLDLEAARLVDAGDADFFAGELAGRLRRLRELRSFLERLAKEAV